MSVEKIGEWKGSSRLGDIEFSIAMEMDPTMPREVHWGVSGPRGVSAEGLIEVDQFLRFSFSNGLLHLSPLALCIAKCVATSVMGPILDCIGTPNYIDCLKSKGISLAGNTAVCIADCISVHVP
ncbi:hypothetical protein PQR64_23190 [Paraburkholderia phytofirmans]|uniref:hypothetical protein n=1 Tax=Paraburkholderia phytofirmans TaxID=261302 RepID=UPI0038B7E033